jgi:hypothetical protein
MSNEEIIVQDHERPSVKDPVTGGNVPKFGCIAVILLGAFFVGILIAGIILGSKMAQDIEAFTDEAPGKIPVERGDPGQLALIRGRVVEFLDKISSTSPGPAELRLSARDLNILIANDTYLADLRGTIHFTEFTAPDMLRTRRTRPMSHIKFWKPRRYLNAFMDYKLVPQEGNISLFVQDIQVDGKKVPDYFLKKFQSQDMLEPYKNDERFLETLKKLKNSRIQEGELILTNSSSQTTTGNNDEQKP